MEVSYKDYEVIGARDDPVHVSTVKCPACQSSYLKLEGHAYPLWGYVPRGKSPWVCKSCVDQLDDCEVCGDSPFVYGQDESVQTPCHTCYRDGCCVTCLRGRDTYMCKDCSKMGSEERKKRQQERMAEEDDEWEQQEEPSSNSTKRNSGWVVRENVIEETGTPRTKKTKKVKAKKKRQPPQKRETAVREWVFPDWAQYGGPNPYEDKGQAEIFVLEKQCFYCEGMTPFPSNFCWECGQRVGRIVHRK